MCKVSRKHTTLDSCEQILNGMYWNIAEFVFKACPYESSDIWHMWRFVTSYIERELMGTRMVVDMRYTKRL